jgi:hypothetical protein
MGQRALWSARSHRNSGYGPKTQAATNHTQTSESPAESPYNKPFRQQVVTIQFGTARVTNRLFSRFDRIVCLLVDLKVLLWIGSRH